MLNPYPGFKATPTTVADASIWVGSNYFDLANPNPAEIYFEDIARALSRECRFGGHGELAISVAEHSVNCVLIFQTHAGGDIYTDPALRSISRDILMHDGHEAYCKDMMSPLKRLIAPAYNPIAARIQAAISARFGLMETAPDWVKRCDVEALAIEKDASMPAAPDWPFLEGVARPEIPVYGMSAERAEYSFTVMAEQLGLIDGAPL